MKQVRAALDLALKGARAFADVRGKYPVEDSRFFHFDKALPFLMSCRASLGAAATLIFSQQLADAPKTIRGAIESAFYGYHAHTDPDAWERWAERPRVSDLRNPRTREARRKQRTAVGREFSVTSIAKEFPSSAARLVEATTELYDEAIDLGGHFNLRAFQATTRVSRSKESTMVHFTLIGASDREIAAALKFFLRVAVDCLRIFDLVFSEYWKPAGVSSEIQKLHDALR